MKKKIKSWLRYWHFNTLAPLSNPNSHGNYLNITEIMDDWFNTDTWENQRGIDEAWIIVLENINKCDEDQLRALDNYRLN